MPSHELKEMEATELEEASTCSLCGYGSEVNEVYVMKEDTGQINVCTRCLLGYTYNILDELNKANKKIEKLKKKKS